MTIWTSSLSRQYAVAIDRLEETLRACPDDRWEESLWMVRKTDRYVWPIARGGGDLPAERKLQMFSAFWNIAYHTLFHLDFYLSGGEREGFAAPAPFREDEHHAYVLPDRVYSRSELLDYLEYGRQKARATLEALTDDQASRPCHRGEPFAELLLINLRHLQEHGGQMSMLLGQERPANQASSSTGI